MQVWFSWMVLNMESIFEEDSQLRRVVEGELVINALTPDQALKVRELFICFYQAELLEKKCSLVLFRFCFHPVLICGVKLWQPVKRNCRTPDAENVLFAESTGPAEAAHRSFPSEAHDLPLGSSGPRYPC